jgi:hypothetical protein
VTPRNHEGLYSGVADLFAKGIFSILRTFFQKYYIKLIIINLSAIFAPTLEQAYD